MTIHVLCLYVSGFFISWEPWGCWNSYTVAFHEHCVKWVGSCVTFYILALEITCLQFHCILLVEKVTGLHRSWEREQKIHHSMGRISKNSHPCHVCSVTKSCLTLCDSKDCHVSLSWTISQSLLYLMSIESVTLSNHLILCHPILLLPSVFSSIRAFSNESALPFRWPKYWGFSNSPSNEYPWLVSFRIDWFDLLIKSHKCSLEYSLFMMHLMRKADFIGKDSDDGKDWGQEEKGTTEDEITGWHHWLDGCEFGWTPGGTDG